MAVDSYLHWSYQREVQLSSASHIVPAGPYRPLSVPPHRGSAPNGESLIGGQVPDYRAPLATHVGPQALIKAQRKAPLCSEAQPAPHHPKDVDIMTVKTD